VATGAFHTVAVTNDGRAYVWGWNTMGQLGLGSLFATPQIREPEPARFFLDSWPSRAVAEVACGYDYTVVRTVNGELYSFGSNNKGQLGLGDRMSRDVPVQVTVLNPRGAQARKHTALKLRMIFLWFFIIIQCPLQAVCVFGRLTLCFVGPFRQDRYRPRAHCRHNSCRNSYGLGQQPMGPARALCHSPAIRWPTRDMLSGRQPG
jgi:hypothetical protein